MTNKVTQIYEKYWQYTAAWTDIHGEKFHKSMAACIDFFSNNSVHSYSSKNYKTLQTEIQTITGINFESARKAINQFVKLGFLKPRMEGINKEAEEFVKANSKEGRIIALSKAVYKHANFQNSMSKTVPEWNGQMKFLIRTLQACKFLSKEDLTAIMTYDFSKNKKEYLTKDELNNIYENAISSGFFYRKYNQVNHLMNLLNRLDNLSKRKGIIYFENDARELFEDEEESKVLSKSRDSYLQREYKRELILETGGKCMVENIEYPVLIASHIRPYKDCRDNNDFKAAFDVNNGLLLSKNLDSLFDLGYITFNDDGTIRPSNNLRQSVKSHLESLQLDKEYLNKERLEYLRFHRKFVFNKRFKRSCI